MIEEQELRDRLWAADVPPSRVEVDALVHAGRRRVVRRRSGQAAIGVALAVGVLVTAIVTRGSVYRGGRQLTLEAPRGQTARAATVADNGLILGLTLDESGESLGPKAWRC